MKGVCARLRCRARLKSNGFAMESEVIVPAGRRGFGIITIPIELRFVDGLATSHYRALLDTLRIAWTDNSPVWLAAPRSNRVSRFVTSSSPGGVLSLRASALSTETNAGSKNR